MNPTITISSPVRNRAYILPYYLDYIRKINYDKSKINLFWVINNSTDNSLQILEKFKSKYNSEYNRIKIVIMNKSNLIEDNRDKKSRVDAIYNHLAEVRNYICQKSNTDYLFSVDSDILILDPEILNKFISYDKDAVSSLIYNGYLFYKTKGNKLPIHHFTNCLNFLHKYDLTGRPIFNHISKYVLLKERKNNLLYKVDITGAIYLIKKEVYKNKNIRYDFDIEGEDLPWCMCVKREGYKLYCDFNTYSQHVMSEEWLQKFLDGEKLD